MAAAMGSGQGFNNEDGALLSDSTSSQMSVSNYHLAGGCGREHTSDTTSDTASATGSASGIACHNFNIFTHAIEKVLIMNLYDMLCFGISKWGLIFYAREINFLCILNTGLWRDLALIYGKCDNPKQRPIVSLFEVNDYFRHYAL